MFQGRRTCISSKGRQKLPPLIHKQCRGATPVLRRSFAKKGDTAILSYSSPPLLQRKTSRTTLLRMDSARDGRARNAKCRHRNGSALNFAALWMPRRTVFPLRKSACIPSVFDALADVANLQDVQYVSARGRCASNNKACSEPLRGWHPLWID